jgi:hypothetical protein
MVKRIIVLALLLVLVVACGDDGNDDSEATLEAEAGDGFTVSVGVAPTFDGCESTGNIDNYKWTILEAPPTKADDNGKVIREVESNCRFTLADTMVVDEMGDWLIELEVRDADGNTATDTVTVTVVEEE